MAEKKLTVKEARSAAQQVVSVRENAAPVDEKVTNNLRYMRDKDREKVKGIFRFHEVPGGTMSFVYRAYKQDPVERYDMLDGEVYTIPLGVAKHLNKNVWYPINAHQVDEAGNPSKIIGRKVKRCSFQSLEFLDDKDLGNTLIEEVVTPNIIV